MHVCDKHFIPCTYEDTLSNKCIIFLPISSVTHLASSGYSYVYGLSNVYACGYIQNFATTCKSVNTQLYIYIYTCIYIHIHTYIHQSISTHTYIHIYIHNEIYWFPTVYCTHIPSIHLHMCSVETFNMEAMSPASQQTLERLVDRLSSGQTIPPRSVRRQLSGILRMGESSRQLVLRLFAVIVFTTHIFCILDRC
jgi:hypothetical protein